MTRFERLAIPTIFILFCLLAADPAAIKVQGPDTAGNPLAIQQLPPGAVLLAPTQLNSSSSNAAAANNQTFTATVGATNYVTGFEITGAGATGTSNITVTLTGILGGTQAYKIVIPAGAGVSITPLIVTFPFPIAASAQNQTVALNVPSFGAGNTDVSVSLHGFRQ